ncbi:MAG TPA: O-antigen ligase family protein [Candidatus Goldiibacteriota bacterium]|nr:O-antigen ligase family protein [Candidatus Goldiibacteriota bacterium]
MKNISLNDLAAYCLAGYAFASAISITMAEACLILGLIAWLASAVRERKSRTPRIAAQVTVALTVFLVIHFINAVFGIDPKSGIRDFGKAWIILTLFFACANSQNEKMRGIISTAFIIGAAFVGAYASINTIYHRYYLAEINFRASSFSGNHMHAGGMLMMAAVFTATMIASRVKFGMWRNRGTILLAAAFILISCGLLFTYTRGSWLGAACGLVIAALLTDKRILAAGVVAALLLVFLMRDTSFIKRAESGIKVKEKSSAGERLYMWQSGIQMIRDRPLIGIGTGNLEKIYPKYRKEGAMEQNAGHLHNNIIQVGVINGIPGILAFLWVFISIWAAFARALAAKPEQGKATLILASLSVSAAFFVNGFFEYNLFSSQPAMMFWFLMGFGFSAVPDVNEPVKT